MTRSEYLEGRVGINRWQISVLGHPYPIQMTKAEEDNMKFVDRQLTTEEMEQAGEWMESDSTEFLDLVNDLLENGYRVTMSRDFKNQCYVVTLMGKTNDNINKDMALATRHGSVAAALHLALYKHIVLYGGGEWSGGGPESLFG
jgi:hypothetical protein